VVAASIMIKRCVVQSEVIYLTSKEFIKLSDVNSLSKRFINIKAQHRFQFLKNFMIFLNYFLCPLQQRHVIQNPFQLCQVLCHFIYVKGSRYADLGFYSAVIFLSLDHSTLQVGSHGDPGCIEVRIIKFFV